MTLLVSRLASWCVYYVLTQRTRLERMALYDPLTGLPNRRLIEDRAQHAISRQRRAQDAGRDTVTAIMLFDLNGFKSVNDRHGDKAGDMVLREIGKRVPPTMRAIDTVGRWGGDEFVVILQDIERQRVPGIADRIREAVGLPIPYDSQTLQVGAAIGIAINPDDGKSVAELLRLADQRMYQSKPQRGNDPA